LSPLYGIPFLCVPPYVQGQFGKTGKIASFALRSYFNLFDMIRGKLHESQQLFEIHYEGDIYVQEIVDFINHTVEQNNLPRRLKAITFATKANFKFKHNDLEPVVEAASRISEKFESFRDAFIIDSPTSTVLATKFKLMTSNSANYKMEIFSTKEAALRWQGSHYLDLEKD
jgi:hypothetical protein